MEPYSIGELSQTDVVIAYIEGIAPDSVLDEVRQRVKRIQIDGVLSQLSLKSLLRTNPFHPFHKFKILSGQMRFVQVY